jgi:hypothetical protein
MLPRNKTTLPGNTNRRHIAYNSNISATHYQSIMVNMVNIVPVHTFI